MAVTEDGHFLLQDAVAGHRWEPLTGRAEVGRLGDDEAFGHCELLDRAVVGTPFQPGTRVRCARRGGARWRWRRAISCYYEAPQPRVPEWRRHAEEGHLGD